MITIKSMNTKRFPCMITIYKFWHDKDTRSLVLGNECWYIVSEKSWFIHHYTLKSTIFYERVTFTFLWPSQKTTFSWSIETLGLSFVPKKAFLYTFLLSSLKRSFKILSFAFWILDVSKNFYNLFIVSLIEVHKLGLTLFVTAKKKCS